MTRGLPGSGKSTWALEEVDKAKGSLKRVNKDSLRQMIDNGRWSKGNEKFVVAGRNTLVNAALLAGHSVVVDDTNFGAVHEDALRAIAQKNNAEFSIKDFTHVSLDECLKRDAKRTGTAQVGPDVIKRMWKDHLYVAPVSPIYDAEKWDCVVVDLDGTVADISHRSPYDASNCFNDTPRAHVIDLIHAIRFARTVMIIFVSGREDKYRDETERWLNKHLNVSRRLFMRATDDMRKDSIIKEEIYRAEIEPHFNVRWVIDDRPSVIRMWRGLGLPVLDVGEGIEF